MRQTVVLLHEQPGHADHFDWMIDQPDHTHEHRLITFRIQHRPDTTGNFQAQSAPDHRAIYLDFQGDIGGNRGTVRRVAQGHVIDWTHADSQIRARIRWINTELTYTATRDRMNPTLWTFHATPTRSP